MMIEDDKPLEESQENVNPTGDTAGNAVDAGPGDGPTLEEVDLDLDEAPTEQSAADMSASDTAASGTATPDAAASGTAASGTAASGTAASDPGAQPTDASAQQEIDRLRSQLDERIGQYMRIAADFENFRKRTQKERQELEVQVKCSTISELLPVIDNFERARSQIKPQTDGEMTIHKSYQGVYKQLVDALKKLGVSPMRAEGEPFDPNLHEAVMREPTSEYEDGTVIEQLMRGYMVGERVLRHAMVKVATASDEPGPEADGAAE